MAKKKRRSKGNGLTVVDAVAKYPHMSNKELAELTGATMSSVYRARWLLRKKEYEEVPAAPAAVIAPLDVRQLDLFEDTPAPQPNNVREELDKSAITDLRIAAELLVRAIQKLA